MGDCSVNIQPLTRIRKSALPNGASGNARLSVIAREQPKQPEAIQNKFANQIRMDCHENQRFSRNDSTPVSKPTSLLSF